MIATFTPTELTRTILKPAMGHGENEMTKQRKMTDAEFTKRVAEVGYVEACVESARRDGAPFNEAAIRKHATEAQRAFAAWTASRR